MTPAEVRKQIKSGDTGPLYLLEGGDLHSRHDLALEFASLVDEGLEAFNVQSFHANEATTGSARDQMIAHLLSAARTLPMMAPRRVVIVQQAEKLLSPRKASDEEAEAPAPRASKKKSRALSPIEEFEAYIESPEPLTTLVFVAGTLEDTRRLVKLVRRHAVAVDCGSLGTNAEAARWIQTRLERDQLKMEAQAVSALLETTGLSLGRIRAEIDKLALYAAGKSAITPQDVRDVVIPQADAGEDFALGRAIWASNARRALREVAALLDDGMPWFVVLGQIRAAARGLQPDDRARSGLDAVFRADVDLKSSIGEPRYVLERLVVELCTR